MTHAPQHSHDCVAPLPGSWVAYFTVHGDPMVVPANAPYPTSRIADVSTAPGDYGKANALLMAAAPDLYWSLVETVGALEGWLRDAEAKSPENSLPTTRAIVEGAKAALARTVHNDGDVS